MNSHPFSSWQSIGSVGSTDIIHRVILSGHGTVVPADPDREPLLIKSQEMIAEAAVTIALLQITKEKFTRTIERAQAALDLSHIKR